MKFDSLSTGWGHHVGGSRRELRDSVGEPSGIWLDRENGKGPAGLLRGLWCLLMEQHDEFTEQWGFHDEDYRMGRRSLMNLSYEAKIGETPVDVRHHVSWGMASGRMVCRIHRILPRKGTGA